MKFSASVNNGTLKFESPETLQAFLESVSGEHEVIIQKPKKARTKPQNALYWKWMEFIGNELGYDKDSMHATFKAMFLTDKSGKIPIVLSTTKLTTKRFSDYMAAIERKMNEIGITLPSPEYFDI